jgi:hypothetical protein
MHGVSVNSLDWEEPQLLLDTSLRTQYTGFMPTDPYDPDELVTITVTRSDIDTLLTWAGFLAMDESGVAVRAAKTRIREAIPAPKWRPTEDQIDAYLQAKELGDVIDNVTYRDVAVEALRDLHKVGLVQ